MPRSPKARRPTSPSERGLGRRLIAIFLVLVVAAGGLVYRLADLQLREGDALVEIGRQQRFRTVQLAGDRGDILDRNGNTLATSLPSSSFYVDPQFVVDPIGDSARLAPVLGRPVEEIRQLLGGTGRFSWLLRQADDAKAAEILAMEIPGVFTTEEPSRFHPSGASLGRAVIGNVDIDSLGLSGVELIYNDLLEGRPGELSLEIGINGDRIPGGPQSLQPAVPGADVVLTIDRSLQFEVERVLMNQVQAMGARGGVVLVTEPSTGEVLAMASVTRNNEGEIISSSLNMATSWSFEPGSVMKAMTFAAVLEEGLGDVDTEMRVEDRFELYDAVFTDSSPHGAATWSIADIMTVSSNVGTIHWAERLGGANLDRYLRSFGFGEMSGLGFPGETRGLMIEPDIWGGVATATTALGQGLSVTPAQMIDAYNTIANNGVYTPLQIVREVEHADGTNEVPAQPDQHQVVSAGTAAKVRSMLENAVAVGTGVNAQVDGYRVAGKTGTARKALDGGAGYEDGAGNFRYVASFVGFLPADRPELSILVTIDQPTASIYASHAAAPPFAEIASFAVRHFRIAPSPTPATAGRVVDVPERLTERVIGEVAIGDASPPVVETPEDAVFAVQRPNDAPPAPAEVPAIEAAPAPVDASEPQAEPQAAPEPVAPAGAPAPFSANTTQGGQGAGFSGSGLDDATP